MAFHFLYLGEKKKKKKDTHIKSLRAFVVGSIIELFGSIVEPNTKKSLSSGSTKASTNC
jgi:hypothetical protein